MVKLTILIVKEGTAVLTYQDSIFVSNLFSESQGISLYGHGIKYEVYPDSESEYDSTEVYAGNLPASVSKRILLQLFKDIECKHSALTKRIQQQF